MNHLRNFHNTLFAISILLSYYCNVYAQENRNVAVSFAVADRNCLPKSNIRIDVIFHNQSDSPFAVSANMEMKNNVGQKVWGNQINLELSGKQKLKVPLMVQAPDLDGEYVITVNNEGHIFSGEIPSEKFTIIKPEKPVRLSKILVTVPEWEHDLDAFIEYWGIEAPSISWGQVVLCGKRTWQQFSEGDKETVQLVDRALRRSMSVIFLDFGPIKEGNGIEKIKLPFSLEAEFMSIQPPESSFTILPTNKYIANKINDLDVMRLNGFDGIAVPSYQMQVKSKSVTITPLVRAGVSPYQFPIIEVKSHNEKGKLILCQLITSGRLDENAKPTRNRPDLPAYDPLVVQFILNLISASVGEDLLK